VYEGARATVASFCFHHHLREQSMRSCHANHRHSIFCVVPPHVLDKIAHNGTPQQRAAALRTNQYVHTFEENGGVHINSGIPNHAFYQVATRIGPAAVAGDGGTTARSAAGGAHPGEDPARGGQARPSANGVPAAPGITTPHVCGVAVGGAAF
jgi:hypothetical protein